MCRVAVCGSPVSRVCGGAREIVRTRARVRDAGVCAVRYKIMALNPLKTREVREVSSKPVHQPRNFSRESGFKKVYRHA